MTPLADEPALNARPDVARMFIDSLAIQDFEHLAATLASDVHLRALLPTEMKEWQGPDRVKATFIRWFGNTHSFELVDAAVHELGPLTHMWWRARMRAERLGEGPFTIEQQAYVDIDHQDRIRRLSLVCSGYLPETPTGS